MLEVGSWVTLNEATATARERTRMQDFMVRRLELQRK
jgi:hypothetical protein